MIAIQKIGRSFTAALKYNLKKFNHPDVLKRAELLGKNFASMDVAFINKEVELVKSLRPNLNRYVYHTSLNFPKSEQAQLSNEKLLAIALDYLEASGFSNNQYIIFRHHDTDHPHIHLLANRICFDGSVVSDSNNYKKSEAILRELEYRYNLTAVEQSGFVAVEHDNNIPVKRDTCKAKEQNIRITRKQNINVSRKSPTRDEIAMILRTGKVSNKLFLQELLIQLMAEKPKSISEFIRSAERIGIHLLFNQASTGRVSGITYCFKDFKAKGQALGNQFKWAELIRKINYSEADNASIAEANKSMKDIYGQLTADEASQHSHKSTDQSAVNGLSDQLLDDKRVDGGERIARNETIANSGPVSINITDDVDDEAIHGRRRNKRSGRS